MWDDPEATGIAGEGKNRPLYWASNQRSGVLSGKSSDSCLIGRLVKRWLKLAGLPSRLSPHSFRLAAITDLLTQEVPLEDV